MDTPDEDTPDECRPDEGQPDENRPDEGRPDEGRPDEGPRHPASAPQLRTLLLTDLCDSTGLVERLGDTPATELFREHDRLVLKLQQQWQGRLIDRSDGLLLLFERPIDGLGFALDYKLGLAEIGATRNLALHARAGLHVGEVLTWRNSDEAIRVGAKALEVEGLAKPITGRLMAMARPGQILLSSMAEPLAHRAASELGERGRQLLWKSHGRWHFKGVPGVQEVHEVSEPGLVPLRAPPSTPKAWRDLPLWRRPAALAVQLALLIGIGIGVWFLAKPQPALAFGERDWVVVGDLRNLTGQSVLDASLAQAFRISLEQSRYVNVISDLKARDTLARMKRDPATVLDRAIASEIALRDGARAVILPSVAEVGGRVRVSVEVIDPHTQATIYAEYADGTGTRSVLGSIDTVTAALRGRFGEAVKSIEHDSAPLPQVSTGNLDALRAYGLGQQAYAIGNTQEALRFYQRATDLDPEFALAWIGQLRAHYANAQAPKAVAALHRAEALRKRLAPREMLYVDAWVSEYDQPSQTRERRVTLARLYPDLVAAQANAAIWLMAENRFAEALPYAKRMTVPQNGMLALAYDDLGEVHLGLEDYPAAAKAFDQAVARGSTSSRRRRARVDAAQRRFESAARFLEAAPRKDRFFDFEKIALAVDRGDWTQAQHSSRAANTGDAESFDRRAIQVTGAVVDWLSGDRKTAERRVLAISRQALDRLPQRGVDSIDNALLAASNALFAQRLGNDSLALQVSKSLQAQPLLLAHPVVSEFDALLQAQTVRRSGHPESAMALLRPFLTGHERYETRVAMMEAAADAGSTTLALEQSRWLQRHRGLAYTQLGCNQCLQAMNVADSNIAILNEAELLTTAGTPEEARQALARFDALRSPQSLPVFLQQRRQALLARIDKGA